jgi:hypothetical protein
MARLEVDYVSGVARIDDPATVLVRVTSEGVEISETLPGTRRVLIRTDALIGAVVERTSGTRRPSTWTRLIPSFLVRPRPSRLTYDCRLMITYCEEGRMRCAVFQPRDPSDATPLEIIARAIETLTTQHADAKIQ